MPRVQEVEGTVDGATDGAGGSRGRACVVLARENVSRPWRRAGVAPLVPHVARCVAKAAECVVMHQTTSR